jgi:adenylosuccinate lyase
MACVGKGLSRQDAHEEIRMVFLLSNTVSSSNVPSGVLSHQAADNVKKLGKDNDLIDRIRQAPFFKPILDDLDRLLDPKTFIGRAPQQVEKFISTEVSGALKPYTEILAKIEIAELKV